MNYKLRGIFSTDPIEAMAQIISSRGAENVESFQYPTELDKEDYNNIDNINEAVELFLKHLNNNNKILIVVDSDVDGITSSATMYNYIKEIYPEANVNYIVHDGKKHGIEDVVEYLEDNEIMYDLIIVPDAGSNNITEMNTLKSVNTDVLVIDHHECEYENYEPIPSNTIVLNNQQSKNFHGKSLTGAGMVYKFLEAVDSKLNINKADDFLDIVALGMIADGCGREQPEANYIISTGLKNIKNECIKTLIQAQSFSLKEKADPPYLGLTTTDIGFYIAPLLNAIVRVGTVKENEIVVESFINPNKIVPSTKRGSFGEAEKICEQVARIGSSCKTRQNKMKEEALERIEMEIINNNINEDNIMVIRLNHDDYNFPNTMTGLIGANICSKYNKPVLIGWENDDGMLKGSIRGNSNYTAMPNLRQYLLDTGYMDSVLGHANAAGFSIQEKNIKKLVKFANKNLSADAFDNCYEVDYVFDANDSDLHSLAYAFAKHPLWFNGAYEVKFIIKNLPFDDVRTIGKDGTTVKITNGGVEYIKFKDAEFFNELEQNPNKKLNILCSYSINCYAGNVTLQAMIDDYELVYDNERYAF